MQKPSAAPNSEPVHLLVRGVNWLGDSVMTTPALQRLRERFPRARVTLLTQEKLADLWRGHPSLDGIETIKPQEGPWSIGRRLRSAGCDLALVLPNSPRSALEVWTAGIPSRIGYAGSWRQWLLTRSVPRLPEQQGLRRKGTREIKQRIDPRRTRNLPNTVGPYLHQMHDYLRLAGALGANPLPLPPKLEIPSREQETAVHWVRELLGSEATNSRGERPWLGVNPSAAYGPAKCWPRERFAAVIRIVGERFPDTVWLVFGSSADREVGEQLAGAGAKAVLNLAGRTSLRQLMALLRACRVLLTNDSGPMHVAAALGTPVVAPFGSTSIELTGPGVPGDARHHLFQARVACAPCFRRTCPIDFRCMTAITVEDVAGAIMQRL